MSQGPSAKRFKANPVEIAIFSIVTLIFFNSVYHLFYDQKAFQPLALTPMASNPVSEGRRGLASTSSGSVPLLQTAEVDCAEKVKMERTTTKLRLAGPLCGVESPAESSTLMEATITNQANQFKATVFPDVNTGRYSTDYIPLNTGENKIQVEFRYKSGGQKFSQNITIMRR